MEEIKDPIVHDPVARESTFEKRINTVLLSVSTALILLTLNFIWNLKGDFATMQERDRERSATMDVMQSSMNKVQLDIQDLKERNTRIETMMQATKK